MIKRPILISESQLVLRIGYRWRCIIPIDNILAIEAANADDIERIKSNTVAVYKNDSNNGYSINNVVDSNCTDEFSSTEVFVGSAMKSSSNIMIKLKNPMFIEKFMKKSVYTDLIILNVDQPKEFFEVFSVPG